MRLSFSFTVILAVVLPLTTNVFEDIFQFVFFWLFFLCGSINWTRLKYMMKPRKWRKEKTETSTGNRSGNLAGGFNHTLVKLNAAMATSENQNCKRQSDNTYYKREEVPWQRFISSSQVLSMTRILVTWCLFSTLFQEGESRYKH